MNPLHGFWWRGLALLVWGGLAGAQACAQSLSLIRDGEIEAILHEYSVPLFETAGLASDEVKIHIVQEDSLNAFVSGGKNIFLFTGLLTAVETPGELKGVIAHEIGHIIGGHNIARNSAVRSASGISLISIGLGVMAIALGAPAAGVAIIAGAKSLAERSLFSYTRVQESAADQASLSLLEKTGQSGAGMISFMEKIRTQEVLSARKQDPYYRTHPTSTARIRALRSRVMAIEDSAGPEEAQAQAQLAMMKAKLIGFLGPPQKVRQLYPKSDNSAPARYARAISAFQSNDLGSAHEEIDALIENQSGNPWFHELKGQILFENGRAAESIVPNERAVEYGPSSALLLVNLARSLLAVAGSENIFRAKKILQEALVLEPDNAFAWGQLANAFGALDQQGEAELAIAEQAFVLGDMERANNFARRAEAHVPLGSISYRRARDILSITRQHVRDKSGRWSQPKNRVSRHLSLTSPL